MHAAAADACPQETPPSPVPARVRPCIPLLSYQREDVESAARFRWNCWARQTGKSFTKSLRRILRGLSRRRTQIFLSAGERQCRELMLKAQQHCQAMSIAAQVRDIQSFRPVHCRGLSIELPAGVRIIGLPANPLTARGFTGDVLLDEFAMHAEDREIWAALFPSLLRGGGELDVASTPRGRGNVFYELGLRERFSRSVVTLPQAVAQGLAVDLDAVRAAMGDAELFRQEFLCEFLDEATAFLTDEQIRACEDPACLPVVDAASLSAIPGDMAVGVDVGRRHDLTVIWVLALRKAGQDAWRLCTAGLIELAHQPFAAQFAVLCDVLKLRRVRRCCIDAGGIGMALAEQAVAMFGEHRVEAVTFTPLLKSQMALGLRRAVEERRIVIPAWERIRRDWHSVERGVSASGALRLSAPRGEQGHADRFWAAALAVYAADLPSGPCEGFPVQPALFARAGSW